MVERNAIINRLSAVETARPPGSRSPDGKTTLQVRRLACRIQEPLQQELKLSQEFDPETATRFARGIVQKQ